MVIVTWGKQQLNVYNFDFVMRLGYEVYNQKCYDLYIYPGGHRGGTYASLKQSIIHFKRHFSSFHYKTYDLSNKRVFPFLGFH